MFFFNALCILKVDSVIDICSDVMNLRSVSYECKCRLEEIKDDYKIEVSLKVGVTEFTNRLSFTDFSRFHHVNILVKNSRNANKQTNKHTNKHTKKQTNKQTNRELVQGNDNRRKKQNLKMLHYTVLVLCILNSS